MGGFEPVIGELRQRRLGIGAVKLLERLRDAPVHPHAPRRRQLVIERLAHERVREVEPGRRPRQLDNEPRCHRFVQRGEQRLLVEVGHLLEHVELEVAARHRGRGHHDVGRVGRRVSRRPMTSFTPSGIPSCSTLIMGTHSPSETVTAPDSMR